MKKIISVILSLIIIASCFSACSSKESNVSGELNIKFTFDSAYSSFDNSIKRGYEAVCNAIVNGESDVRVNIGMLDDINQLIYTSFPLSYLVASIDVNKDKSGIYIEYKNDLDKHLELVKAFDDKVKSLENALEYDTLSDNQYVLRVYDYITSNIKISPNMAISLYETIMNDEGSIFSYSNMFEYLLLQKGIEAYHIIAQDAGGGGWTVSCAKLCDNYYYFDVASEFYSNTGSRLEFFAMNFDDLKNEGLNNIIYTNKKDAMICDDDKFSACRECRTWSINENIVEIITTNGESVEINIE